MPRKTTVEQLMTREPATCMPESTLNDAAHMMWAHDCGSIPVVLGESDRRVVGMITDRDICMAAYHTGRNLKELRVRDSMSKEVLACRRDDDVADASELMRRAQVRRLPVTDAEGRLEGVLTLAHLARAAERGNGPALSQAELGTTLAAISRPTRPAEAQVPR